MRARIRLAPPIRRSPSALYPGIRRTDPRGSRILWFLRQVSGSRRFNRGSGVFAFLIPTCPRWTSDFDTNAHHRRLLTAAAWRGLEPAPGSRLRRAFLHLSCSLCTIGQFIANLPFLRLRRTLDLPAQGIPAQLLDRRPVRPDGQVGDQLPVDRGSIGGRGTLPGLDHREPERGIALLLADGWQNANTAVLDFDSRDLDTALAVANLNLMHALDAHFIHLGSYRVMTITRTTVDAAPDDEVGAELLGRAEQLVDVALAITNVDAAGRRTEQGHGLAQVLQPADALLGLDGHARRIDLALERGGALELPPRPELHGREAQRQTFRRHRKGGVHEKATARVHPE